MSQDTHTRRILPEVLLIAVLLLITGIAGTIRQVYGIWQWHLYAQSPIVQFLASIDRWMSPLQAVVFLVLNIAAVVVAVGLLRHYRWARRAALGVLAGLVVVPICFGLLSTVQLLLPALRYGIFWQGLSSRIPWLAFLTMLLYPLNYLVMFAFLAARRVSEAWNESPMPLAQRLVGPLSAAMPPVIALIALLMVSSALPGLISLPPQLANLRMVLSFHQRDMMRTAQTLGLITTLGTFAAGILLLLRARGAAAIAVFVLFISSVIPGMTIFALRNYYRGGDHAFTFSGIAITLLLTLSSILVYLTQAGFLVRFRGTSTR